MVAPLIPVLSLVGVLAAFLLYPRLPQYNFQIRSVWPTYYEEAGFRAKLGSKISLINDNHIDIDVYGLSFDLYYPDRWAATRIFGDAGTVPMELLGNVQDIPSLEAKAKEGERRTKRQSQWKLKARQPFETRDSVLMAPIGGLGVTLSIVWDMIRSGLEVHLPSTGAIHIKASGQLPITLNILCDNILNGWTMEMRGMDCDLESLDVGWKDMELALLDLQPKVPMATNGGQSPTYFTKRSQKKFIPREDEPPLAISAS